MFNLALLESECFRKRTTCSNRFTLPVRGFRAFSLPTLQCVGKGAYES